METVKRSEWFYHSLFVNVYADIACAFGLRLSEYRAEKAMLERRFRKEGLGFYTKTLPKVGKLFDAALSGLTKFDVPHFHHRKSGGIKFLSWLFDYVFDSDGNLLKDPRETPVSTVELRRTEWPLREERNLLFTKQQQCVRCIRQLLYFLYKLELPHDKSTSNDMLDSFVAVDTELPDNLEALPSVTRCILDKATALVARVFRGFDPADIIPSHGPGAVATGEVGPQKLTFRRLYTDLEQKYPFTEYFMFNMNHVVADFAYRESLEVLKSGTAKVVLVPKDSRGPRVISCEPLEYQWIQQGLARAVMKRLESHWLTKGHVNFTDQRVNRQLALEGSQAESLNAWTDTQNNWLWAYAYVSGREFKEMPRRPNWVTLDMKEASDRVSSTLVRAMFSSCSVLMEAIFACRSTHTRLPDGRLIELRKFAPMGSALCFPVESLCFYALCVAALHVRRNLTLAQARERVFVYGDDIICDSEDYTVIVDTLPEFGLMFNSGKCCTAGPFRESCGMDAFNGACVTPVKIRSLWSSRTLDPSQLCSYVSYSNSLFERGYYRAAAWLEDSISQMGFRIPYSTHGNTGAVCYVRPRECVKTKADQLGIRRRFNRDLHRLEWFVLTTVPRYIRSESCPWRMLLSRLRDTRTKAGVYAVAHRSYLKRAWAPL